MTSMLSMRGAGYRFPGGGSAVGPVGIELRAGELVLLTGPTGCGKSTLLRLAAGLLPRHGRGERTGTVEVGGRDPVEVAPSERVGMLGFVSQVPSRQLVTGTVGDEPAFPLESAGWSAERIEARVTEVLAAFGLPNEPGRSTSALSGGQQQRLVTASALAGGAGLLLLDEPLSQLDPRGAADLMGRLAESAAGGVCVLLVEHRLSACLPHADRVLVMDRGALRWDGPPAELPQELLEELGLSRPQPRPGQPAPERESVPLIEGRAGWTWPGSAAPALHDIDVTLHRGERLALVGGNGAGKSTLLALLTGDLDAPGLVRRGQVVDVPQDPDLALFCETVREELAHGPAEQRLRGDAVETRIAKAAHALSVSELLERPPQALSRGQRLRTAVAAALSCQPDVLVLDEPTSGQDPAQVERMMAALAASDSRALVFATHDLDLARRWATRVVVLHEGRVALQGPPGILDSLPSHLPLTAEVR